METPVTEIILLKVPADCDVTRPCYNRFPGRPAPLGLFCLAAVAPQRIAVIDAQSLHGIFEMLVFFQATAIKAIVCQVSERTDPLKLADLIMKLRQMFPGAMTGVNSELPRLPAGFDFSVSGTGKAAMLRILRGDRLAGFLDCSHDDALSPLPLPEEPLQDCGYDIFPEKWLHANTFEVFQPWQGLLDQSLAQKTWPGLDWVARLVTWLKSSGIASFHFRPSGLGCDGLHELRSLMLNLKARFAVSFAAEDQLNIRQIGWPLQQVWLYHLTPAAMLHLREHLLQIREAGFEACLQIDSSWLEFSGANSLLKLVDRLEISDDGCWPFAELKKLTGRYWGGRSRFIRRLFSIRSASELVMFMKTSSVMLETIFSSCEKGR